MKKVLILEDLCCANCAQKIEDAATKVDGMVSCQVSFLTQKMKMEIDDSRVDSVMTEVMKIIKKIEPDVTVVEK